MPSSDDYYGTLTSNVLDYQFVIGEVQPISFAELPVKWNKGEDTPVVKKNVIFLCGTADNGLRKIYKEVTSWKFELLHEKPKISVLSEDGHRFILLNPRKSYLVYIKTILITVHSLHFMKWNPQGSLEAMCSHLSKVLSMLEHKPSVDDMLDHISLITEAVTRDGTLTKSKLLVTFLEDNLKEMNATTKDGVIDDNEDDDPKENDVSGDDDKCREDDVCAICDNGGRLLICEGSCMRSFHPTVEDGADSSCPSLGYTDAEYEVIEQLDFYCKNCKHKQHQCFACGNLGSSDESSGAEVLRCGNGSCGHFYHPHCVAKLLHPGNMTDAEDQGKKIAGGEQFTCPRHICYSCKGLELSVVSDLQFAICRRCPRAFHRKCLPRKIAFEKDVDESKSIVQRAWEGLIPNNRILIYCLKHEIDIQVSTPARNHIKFPKSARERSVDEKRKTPKVRPIVKTADKTSNLDADTKKRVLTVTKNTSSSTTPEKIKEKRRVLSTHDQSSKFSADFALGRRVKGSVGIVDKVHWYAQDGDMVVDFCCDTNDISCHMKKKLDEVGKCCSFRNYDFEQLKNDFNFEGKYYLEVLLDVSIKQARLIMVLSPSPGFDAANLDERISKKTLDNLKPKLLMLVAPRETTMRSYEKDFPYDLIWEDDRIFADNYGNSPGSINSSGRRIKDGNGDAPILYLWSCPDHTTVYNAIAEEHGHLSRIQKNSKPEGRQHECQNIDEFLANIEEDQSGAQSKESSGMKRKLRWKCVILDDDNSNSTNDHSTSQHTPTKRVHSKCQSGENDADTPSRTPCSRRSEQKSHPTPDATSPHISSVNRSRLKIRSLGFASAPCRPFSQENTAGWLEE